MEDKLNHIDTFTETVSNSSFCLMGKERKEDEDHAKVLKNEPGSSNDKDNEFEKDLVIDIKLRKIGSSPEDTGTVTSRADLQRSQESGDLSFSFEIDGRNLDENQEEFMNGCRDNPFCESESTSNQKLGDIDKETYDLCLSYLFSKHTEQFEEDMTHLQFSAISGTDVDSDPIDSATITEFVSKYNPFYYSQLNHATIEWNDDDIESQTTLLNACSLELSRCANSFSMVDALSDYVLDCYKAIFNGGDQNVDAMFTEPIMLAYDKMDAEERKSQGSYTENMFSLSAISAQSQFLPSNGSKQETQFKNLFINGSYNTICSSSTRYSETNFVVGDRESSICFTDLNSDSITSLSAKKGDKEICFFDGICYTKSLDEEIKEECDVDSKECKHDIDQVVEHDNVVTPSQLIASVEQDTHENTNEGKDAATALSTDKVPTCLIQHVSHKVGVRKQSKDTNGSDDIGVVSRKTVEVLYPVKANDTCCLSCHAFGGIDDYEEPQKLTFHPCMTGDYIDHSEAIEEEEEDVVVMEPEIEETDADEDSSMLYEGREGGSCGHSILSDTWSFIDALDQDDMDDRRAKLKSVFNNSEFKDGVLNVLEDFLKDNILISNMKSDDYDVYIIPKADGKSGVGSSLVSKSLSSRVYKCHSLGCNHCDSERPKGSRRSPRTMSTPKCKVRDSDDLYDFSEMGSDNYYDLTHKECTDCNKFRSWPLFHPKRIQSASNSAGPHSESEYKKTFHTGPGRSPSNSYFGNTDASTMASVSHSFGDYDNENFNDNDYDGDGDGDVDGDGQGVGNKTVELIKAPRQGIQKSVLEELNDFKRVLSEVERRQNALLQLLRSDPCGLSYNFPGEPNIT